MKYKIIDNQDHLLIKISGDTRNNEALLAKKMLSPFLRNKRLTVIVDLKELVAFEPAVLVGVLNGIKKEVEFSKGNLKLCSVRAEIRFFFKENRLDRIFRVCEHGRDIDGTKQRKPGKGSSNWGTSP